ncbi:MAG TPA: prepilin-type N-terminal cleavage/methylation domain-containing protein [Vicinamibacteria bacterium]|nr:prepilin-type N-terminal cleavage/methylation domain-containing protein [Vicinamibacteria bacterium]
MRSRKGAPGPGQRGFSLVELLVAMAVTLVVSGSIYGLLAAGQNAFRREPSLADRQQNIRIAMDIIAHDVANAGTGMPLVSQVFTHTDAPLGGPAPTGFGAPYLNGAGPQGVLGATGEALRGGGATGAGADGSDNSDVLEILGADPTCPAFRICPPRQAIDFTGAALAAVPTFEQIPIGSCLVGTGNPGDTGLVLLTDPSANRSFTIQPATLNAAGAGCTSAPAGTSGNLSLAASLPEWPVASPFSAAQANGIQAFLYSARVVRYMIAPGLDPADTSPGLWRSETGRYTSTGALAAVPAAGATNWQLVARGIEDLQVEYLNGGGLWANNPGIVNTCVPAGCTPADYARIVRRVRVTLSARALEPRLQGETQAAGAGPNAVRGTLVSVITPQAAVTGLQTRDVSPSTNFQ